MLSGWLLGNADKPARVSEQHSETPYITLRLMRTHSFRRAFPTSSVIPCAGSVSISRFSASISPLITTSSTKIERSTSRSKAFSNTFDRTLGARRAYWSKNFKLGLPFSNAAHYSCPEVDRLLEAAAVDSDPVRRRDIWWKFQEIIQQEVASVDLVAPAGIILANKRVTSSLAPRDLPGALRTCGSIRAPE